MYIVKKKKKNILPYEFYSSAAFCNKSLQSGISLSARREASMISLLTHVMDSAAEWC